MISNSSVCSVSYQARALCSQRASTEQHRFIVGTCSLHESNEISILQYFEDSNFFEISSVFTHQDQVWALEASPKDPSLLITSRQSKDFPPTKCMTLWKMPNQSIEEINIETPQGSTIENLDLSELSTFGRSQKSSIVDCIKWSALEDQLISLDNRNLSLWKIYEDTIKLESVLDFKDINDNSGKANPFKNDSIGKNNGTACWDPHSAHTCALAVENNIHIIDSKSMSSTNKKQFAHDSTIRDLDYNPNKPNILISSGNDRKVKFWDLRNFSKPLKTLAGHSHWVTSAKYNPFHDQLLISGGSDHLVNLWRIASCSSAPWLGIDDNTNDPPDVKVRSIDQHEESIYGLAWSPVDAWIFCSLSYDGRVMINHVPSTEKYKILL